MYAMPGISYDTIARNLCSAVEELYRKEPDIDSFSSETRQTEWNLAAHLGPEILTYFTGYSYDIDVMKIHHNNKRPDIIIHKRGTNDYNLLVVEVKREGSEADAEDDKRKIEEYWFSDRLHYRFGATVNLKVDHVPDIRVFDNQREVSGEI